MKRIIIFFVLFIGVFCLTSNFAQAETITQTIPIKIEQQEQSLFNNFLQKLKETFLPQVLADTYSRTLGGNYDNINCPQTGWSWKYCTDYLTLKSNIKICNINLGDEFVNQITQ